MLFTSMDKMSWSLCSPYSGALQFNWHFSSVQFCHFVHVFIEPRPTGSAWFRSGVSCAISRGCVSWNESRAHGQTLASDDSAICRSNLGSYVPPRTRRGFADLMDVWHNVVPPEAPAGVSTYLIFRSTVNDR